MAINTTKSKAEIGVGGGNIAYIREVTEAGVDLGTPDTNHTLGHLKESGLLDEDTVLKYKTEDGEVRRLINTGRDITWNTVLSQSSKAMIDLKEEMRDKFYRLYYQGSKRNNKTPEWLFGICQLAPKLELAWKEGEVTHIPLAITVIKNDAQISIANSTLPSEKVTATDPVLIPAGKYYVMIET